MLKHYFLLLQIIKLSFSPQKPSLFHSIICGFPFFAAHQFPAASITIGFGNIILGAWCLKCKDVCLYISNIYMYKWLKWCLVCFMSISSSICCMNYNIFSVMFMYDIAPRYNHTINTTIVNDICMSAATNKLSSLGPGQTLSISIVNNNPESRGR